MNGIKTEIKENLNAAKGARTQPWKLLDKSKMKRNFDNKLTDTKRAEQDRRTKLAMMYLLMQEHPREAVEKARKLTLNKPHRTAEKSLVLRE